VDPKYRPAVMLSTRFTDDLMNRRNPKTVQQVWQSELGKVSSQRDEEGNRIEGGYNIFEDVCRIFVPHNIGNWHWVLFEINPSTMDQKYYDSLWGELGGEESAVSWHIHNCLTQYYEATQGCVHPSQKKWTRNLVTDSYSILGNALQVWNDCGLHTCIVAVLIQNGIPLNVLGEERDKVSVEMRVRMTLTMARDEWYFDTDMAWLEKKLKTRKRERHMEFVTENTLIPQIRDLSQSIEAPKGYKRIKRDKK
jgi:hypothetical protein